MEPQNLLVLMSDQHNPRMTGLCRPRDRKDTESRCAGRPGYTLYGCLFELPDLCAGACKFHDRSVMFTGSVTGTMPWLMMAAYRVGGIDCGRTGFRWKASESCTFAMKPTTPASIGRPSPCILRMESGKYGDRYVIHCRSAKAVR